MNSRVSSDDLLVLLEVARLGRYTRVADAMGLNHTTVARRIEAVERSLGGKVVTRSSGGWELTPLGRHAVEAAESISEALDHLSENPRGAHSISDIVRVSTPDAFSFHIAAPASARVRAKHAGVSVEIVSATRRAATQRSGLDIEVVVGKPDVLRAEARLLGSYALGMYASHQYLEQHGEPLNMRELHDHALVYFIPSMLQVDYLDVGRRIVPDMRDAVTSTNVVAHVEATRAGAGIGLVPTFLADQHSDLRRVLLSDVDQALDYWMVTRTDNMSRPAITVVADEICRTFAERSDPDGRLQ